MKLRINEAESDYIRIGNKLYPKDASGFGYADADTVARAAKRSRDAEIKAEEEAKEKARMAELGKEDYEKFERIVTSENYSEDELRDILSELFDEFVPGQGKCETLAGELIRAVNRVGYRYFNDGDYFMTGYGLETCGPDMAFIYDNTDETVQKAIDRAADLNEMLYDDNQFDKEYSERINKVFNLVLQYLSANPDVFGMTTEDSRDYKSDIIDEWEYMSKSYEYEVDTWAVSECIDNGWTDWGEVYQNVEDWVNYDIQQGEVDAWARDAITIRGLDREHYQQCCDDIEGWMQQWVDELYKEHENDEEEYEDEEEYDEDEEE